MVGLKIQILFKGIALLLLDPVQCCMYYKFHVIIMLLCFLLRNQVSVSLGRKHVEKVSNKWQTSQTQLYSDIPYILDAVCHEQFISK